MKARTCAPSEVRMAAGEGVGPEKPVHNAWGKEGIGWGTVLECAEVWAEKASGPPHTGK